MTTPSKLTSRRLQRISDFLTATAEDRIIAELFDKITAPDRAALVAEMKTTIRQKIESWVDSVIAAEFSDALRGTVQTLFREHFRLSGAGTLYQSEWATRNPDHAQRLKGLTTATLAKWIDSPAGRQWIAQQVEREAPSYFAPEIKAVVQASVRERLLATTTKI